VSPISNLISHRSVEAGVVGEAAGDPPVIRLSRRRSPGDFIFLAGDLSVHSRDDITCAGELL